MLDTGVLAALQAKYFGKMREMSCGFHADPGSVKLTLRSFSGVMLLFGALLGLALFVLGAEVALAWWKSDHNAWRTYILGVLQRL
jgi:hypothetical protein